MFLEVKASTDVGFTSECDANQHKKSNWYFYVYGLVMLRKNQRFVSK